MSDLTRQPDELVPLTQAIVLSNMDVLDVGCGAGGLARRIAAKADVASITAIDNDISQITDNIDANPKNVRFAVGDAAALPLPSNGVDVVVMMKSLHHVPVKHMDEAFSELARVLRPGGYLYVCEPAYAGAFNEIMSLFHDEGPERAAALKAIDRAVTSGQFSITKRPDYLRPIEFLSLDDFRERMMDLPWLKSRITPEIEKRVRSAWKTHANIDGGASFTSRMLVFVMRKV